MTIEGGPWTVIFLGECQGVGLKLRASTPDDRHLCFVVLTEDDGHWFPARRPELGASTCWLDDLRRQLQKAEEWLWRNAVREIDSENGSFYGYRLAP